MRYLLVSHYYPSDILSFCENNSKAGLDYAADNLCRSIIHGFNLNNCNFDVINIPNVGSFPARFKKAYVKELRENDIYSIPFLNLPILKNWFIRTSLVKAVSSWIKHHSNDSLTIVLYSTPNMNFVSYIKQNYPDVKIAIIVTDLPQFMASGDSKLVASYMKRKAKKFNDAWFSFDGFILLSEKMKDKLPINGRPYIQMEGIYNDTCKMDGVEPITKKVVMYTGNLDERYGLKMLVDAFMEIEDSDMRLWIRGSGAMKNYISECVKKDNRIVLLNKMSRCDLIKSQKQATVLVNPVPPTKEFTKYFFPSKTLEYLASGTATLMYHLESIPSEYDEHLFYIEGTEKDNLKQSIINICSKSNKELEEHGKAASLFIMEEKCPQKQVAKLITFMKSL